MKHRKIMESTVIILFVMSLMANGILYTKLQDKQKKMTYRIVEQNIFNTPEVMLKLDDLSAVNNKIIYSDENVTIKIDEVQVHNERYVLCFVFENLKEESEENYQTISTRWFYFDGAGGPSWQGKGMLEVSVDGVWYPCQSRTEGKTPGGNWMAAYYLDCVFEENYSPIVMEQAEKGEITIRLTGIVNTKWIKWGMP